MPLVTPSVVIDMFDMSGGWVPDASQFSLDPNELLAAENVELDYRGGFRVRAGYANVANAGVTFHHLATYTESDGDHHLVGVTSAGDIYQGTSLTMADTLNNLAAYTIGTDPDREYDVAFTQLRDYLYVSSLRGNTWRFDGTTWLEITDSTLNGGGVDGTPEFPQAKSTLALHNRVFAANIKDGANIYRSRIVWSTLTAGTDQYGGNRFEATSFIDVQEDDGGQIHAIHPFQSTIIIFKDDAVYVMAGDDESSFSVFPSDDTVGTTVSGSIASDESVLFFLDPRSGVYAFDGVKAQRIDEQINDHLMGIIAGFSSDKLFAKGWIEDSKYFLCIGQMDGNKETFVFDMRYQAWVHWDMTWADVVSYKDVTFHAGNDGTSGFRDRVYLDDDGSDIVWDVKTAWVPPAPEQDMRQYRLRRFDISSQYVSGGAAGYTLNVFADNDDSTPVYTQSPDGDEATERMPGYDGLVHRFMVQYTGTNTSAVSTDRRILGCAVKMSARPSKGSFGAGLTGPTSPIIDTRNYPGIYWRLIDETYALDSWSAPLPEGGTNGDHLILIVSRDSAWQIEPGAIPGYTIDIQRSQSLGDNRTLAVLSKKVTDWSSETAPTMTPDGQAMLKHFAVILVRGLAAASWYKDGASFDHQGVVDDFDIQSATSAPKDMVLRAWFAEQHIANTTGVAALALEANGYQLQAPTNDSYGSEEIFLHDARMGSDETGTFTIVFGDSAGPEVMSITAVYE